MEKKISGGLDWRFRLEVMAMHIGRIDGFIEQAVDWSEGYLAEYVPILDQDGRRILGNHWSAIWYELWKLGIPTRDMKKLLKLNSEWSAAVRQNNRWLALTVMDEIDEIFKKY